MGEKTARHNVIPDPAIFSGTGEENLSTDAGLLIFRQFDQQQDLTSGFTQQLNDPRRDPDHSMLERVRSALARTGPCQ
jgi:hypothetical protein